MTNIADDDPSGPAIDKDELLLGSIVLEKPFFGTDLLRSIKMATGRSEIAKAFMLNTTAKAEWNWSGLPNRRGNV